MGFGCGSTDPIFTVAYVTLSKGYFRDAGLDVDYLDSQSGPRSKQMLAAGQIMAATSGATDAMAVSIAGKPATLVFGLDRKITFANILVHKDDYDSGKIREVKDLSGQRMGVTQPQSATWLMAVFLTERAGAKDVEFRGLGDFTTMLGALKAKQVAATIATIGMVQRAPTGLRGADLRGDNDAELAGRVRRRRAGARLLRHAGQRHQARERVAGLRLGHGTRPGFRQRQQPEAITDLIHEEYLHAFDKEAILKTIALYKDKVFTHDNLIGKAEYERLLAIMGGGRQFSDDEIKRSHMNRPWTCASCARRAT